MVARTVVLRTGAYQRPHRPAGAETLQRICSRSTSRTTATRERVRLSNLGAVIFTSGFRPDYSSWVGCPGAFDELGFPVHDDGASTVVAGLHFVGVHFLRKRKSSLLIGVGEDAAIVASRIASAS